MKSDAQIKLNGVAIALANTTQLDLSDDRLKRIMRLAADINEYSKELYFEKL